MYRQVKQRKDPRYFNENSRSDLGGFLGKFPSELQENNHNSPGQTRYLHSCIQLRVISKAISFLLCCSMTSELTTTQMIGREVHQEVQRLPTSWCCGVFSPPCWTGASVCCCGDFWLVSSCCLHWSRSQCRFFSLWDFGNVCSFVWRTEGRRLVIFPRWIKRNVFFLRMDLDHTRFLLPQPTDTC